MHSKLDILTRVANNKISAEVTNKSTLLLTKNKALMDKINFILED